MNLSELPGKVIADRNSRKLDFVIDIRNNVASIGENQKSKATMIVKIDRALRDAITVEVDVERILKIEGYYAWLDTTKKEFFESIKNKKRVKQEKREIRKSDLVIPKNINSSHPTTEKKIEKKSSDTGDLRESNALKEYNLGRRPKIKTPWISIIIIGLLTAVLSFVLFVFGIVTMGNPYAMNMIIGLLGIPAGFIIAFKNKTLDIMVSWRYSSFTALIYSATFFVIGIVITSIGSLGLGNLFGGLLSLLLSCLVITGYSVLVTFAVGALLGTMVHGYLDDRK